MMSPADTVIEYGWPARRVFAALARCATPPAGTLAGVPSGPGASIYIFGGSRLPWKSLIARIWSSIGCAAGASATGTGAVVAQPASNSANAAIAAGILIAADSVQVAGATLPRIRADR